MSLLKSASCSARDPVARNSAAAANQAASDDNLLAAHTAAHAADTTSLDAPHDRANGDPYTLAELIPAPETALEDAVAEADWHVYQRAQVTAALATLDERARFVLELRYGFIAK
jgi:DNA-directed RNA polymerase sigma subunit (sigma70/sigma32)